MGDIYCRVCTEPYDAYGVRKDGKGDMAGWEATLFLKGAGCPCCVGVLPVGASADDNNYDGLRSLLTNGYDDFGHNDPLATADLDLEVPKWEKPADKVHWTCDGCGVQVVTDPEHIGSEFELEYHLPLKAKANQWYSSHPFNSRNADPQPEPFHTFENGTKVCEFCHVSCDHCGTSLADNVDHSELGCESEGYVFRGWEGLDSGNSYCYECITTQCEKCHAITRSDVEDCESECTCETCEVCETTYDSSHESCQCCDECEKHPCECEDSDN